MKRRKRTKGKSKRKPNGNGVIPLPTTSSKRGTLGFNGDPISSNSGMVLPATADRRLGISATLARAIRDRRDAWRSKHKFVDIFRSRLALICAGYPDANDVHVCWTQPRDQDGGRKGSARRPWPCQPVYDLPP